MVSVIIPNYNHEQYLRERIESVLNQTYHDFEVIILDDCSKDNSKEVIESYRSNPKVSQIVYNKQNSGTTFKQWQKGIGLAKGELIWIAESDDWCEKTLLETLVAGIVSKANCSLAFCQSYVVIDQNQISWQSHHDKIVEYVNGIDFIKLYMLNKNTVINASMAIFKREVFINISNDYTTFRFCGDWVFWIEVARQGDIFISGKCLNYFRKHKNDVTGKALASGINFIEELKILKSFLTLGTISETEYDHALLFKYKIFASQKSQFSLQAVIEIQKLFFYNLGYSKKAYLERTYSIYSLKNRIKHLINSFSSSIN